MIVWVIHPSIHPSTHPPIHPSIPSSVHNVVTWFNGISGRRLDDAYYQKRPTISSNSCIYRIYLSMYLSIYVCIYVSIYTCLYLCIYLLPLPRSNPLFQTATPLQHVYSDMDTFTLSDHIGKSPLDFAPRYLGLML